MKIQFDTNQYFKKLKNIDIIKNNFLKYNIKFWM